MDEQQVAPLQNTPGQPIPPSTTPSKLASHSFLRWIIGGVVGLMVIVAAFVFLPRLFLQNQVTESRDLTRASDVGQIQRALQIYFQDNNSYPPDLSVLVPNYIGRMPSDPESEQPYSYEITQGGQDYQLCANYTGKGRSCVTENTHPEGINPEGSQ